MTRSFESPFLICIQTVKEDAKGSEKPSSVRPQKKTSAVRADTWDWARDTQERSAEQIWPGTLIKIKLLKENEVQNMDLRGGKEERELKWSHWVTHTADKHTARGKGKSGLPAMTKS